MLFWLYWSCRDLDWGLDLDLFLDGVHVDLYEKLEKLFDGISGAVAGVGSQVFVGTRDSRVNELHKLYSLGVEMVRVLPSVAAAQGGA